MAPSKKSTAPAAESKPSGKGGKSKAAAKRANASADKVLVLTKRSCDHCGEKIAVGQITTIKSVVVSPLGKMNTTMRTFAKNHPQTAQAGPCEIPCH